MYNVSGRLSFTALVLLLLFCSACGANPDGDIEEKPVHKQESVQAPQTQDDTESMETSGDHSEIDDMFDVLEEQGISTGDTEAFRELLEQRVEAETRAKQEKEQKVIQNATDREAQRQAEAEQLETTVQPEPGKLKIGVKGKVYSLAISHCSTKTERHANLMTLAQVEAAGSFRGSPVLATLSKSHPAGSQSRSFEHLKIWLTSVRSDEASLNNREIVERRQEDYNDWYKTRYAEIIKAYKVTDDMSVDELNAQLQAQSEAVDELEEEGKPRELQYAIAHGDVTIEAGTVSLLSPNISLTGQGKTPDAFFDIEDSQVYAVGQCQG